MNKKLHVYVKTTFIFFKEQCFVNQLTCMYVVVMSGSFYVHSLSTKKNHTYFVRFKYIWFWIAKYLFLNYGRFQALYHIHVQLSINPNGFLCSRTRSEGSTALRSTQMTGRRMCSPRSRRLRWTTGSRCWTRSSTRQRQPPMSPWRRVEVLCEIFIICGFWWILSRGIVWDL